MGKLQSAAKAAKETLLIEEVIAKQAEKKQAVKSLAGVDAEATPHNLYNTVHEVVWSKAFGKSTETSLRD